MRDWKRIGILFFFFSYGKAIRLSGTQNDRLSRWRIVRGTVTKQKSNLSPVGDERVQRTALRNQRDVNRPAQTSFARVNWIMFHGRATCGLHAWHPMFIWRTATIKTTETRARTPNYGRSLTIGDRSRELDERTWWDETWKQWRNELIVQKEIAIYIKQSINNVLIVI